MKRTASTFMKIVLNSFLLVLLFIHCGKTPSEPPAPVTGSIEITAAIDTSLADSMEIWLDNIPQGKQANPCILENVIAGSHQVALTKEDTASPIDYTCSPQVVHVKENKMASVSFALTKLAPDFTLKNLSNEDVTLSEFQGKVVLLIFYSHT